MNDDGVMRSLGRIEGQLDSLEKKVDGLQVATEKQDKRLRDVEIKSYVGTTFIAALISVGIAYAKEKLGG